MNNSLQRLIYLAYKKNQLNKRRTRFYYHLNFGKRTHITKKDAAYHYRLVVKEMKALTPEMRQLRQRLDAKLIWDDNWHIRGVLHDTVLISEDKFRSFYDSELFDMEVFNGSN